MFTQMCQGDGCQLSVFSYQRKGVSVVGFQLSVKRFLMNLRSLTDR